MEEGEALGQRKEKQTGLGKERRKGSKKWREVKGQEKERVAWRGGEAEN